ELAVRVQPCHPNGGAVEHRPELLLSLPPRLLLLPPLRDVHPDARERDRPPRRVAQDAPAAGMPAFLPIRPHPPELSVQLAVSRERARDGPAPPPAVLRVHAPDQRLRSSPELLRRDAGQLRQVRRPMDLARRQIDLPRAGPCCFEREPRAPLAG